MKIPFGGIDDALKSSLRPTSHNPGFDSLWCWFGLGRSSWLTIPRVLLHQMPDEWQGKMADLLREYESTFPNQPDVSTHVSIKKSNHFTDEYAWMNNYRYPDMDKIDSMRIGSEK